MHALKLRPYQIEALTCLDMAWTGQKRPTARAPWDKVLRAAVVLPTGMGKTVIFAELIRRTVARGERVLVLVHREELADQAAHKIRSAAPGVTVGIVKADRNDVWAQVIVGSVQTLANRKRREQINPANIALGIVDECHHAAAKTWREVMEFFGAWSGTRWAGFTATMHREDKAHLGDIWQEIVIRRDIMDGIRDGHLVDVRGVSVQVQDFDLDEVKRSRGDYQAGDLGEALSAADAGNTIAEAYKEHAADRQGLLFAPTVPTAFEFAEELADAGITTDVITGETPAEERRRIYSAYRAGRLQVISNCMVLTEGFDMPQASCAVIARPTSNPGLYIQMVGRVLRPWDMPPVGGFSPKKDALVLDVVGVTAKMKLCALATLTQTPVSEGVKASESLREAVIRTEMEAADEAERVRLQGELVSRQVDLFEGSDSAWLQTAGGLMFIPTRNSYFFLWPRPDGYFTLGKVGTRGGKATRLEDELTLDYARAWAESYATEDDPSVSSRTASWRKRRATPSEAQVSFASGLGIRVEGLSKSELSDAISTKMASRMLDKMLPKK